MFNSMILAQAAAPVAATTGFQFQQLMPLALVFGIFYFLLIRPQMRQQKQVRAMLEQIKRGDEVLLNSGIYGKIIDIKDQTIQLQIASQVLIKCERSSIARVIPDAAAEHKKAA